MYTAVLLKVLIFSDYMYDCTQTKFSTIDSTKLSIVQQILTLIVYMYYRVSIVFNLPNLEFL